MHPALLRSASSCVWPIRFGPAFSSAARSEGAGIRAASAARSKLTASAAHGEACASLEVILRFFIQRFIQPSEIKSIQEIHFPSKLKAHIRKKRELRRAGKNVAKPLSRRESGRAARDRNIFGQRSPVLEAEAVIHSNRVVNGRFKEQQRDG